MSNNIEIEKLMVFYDRLIENVKQISLDASEQIDKLKGFAVADEIASDFSDIAKPYAIKLFENGWLSDEQLNIVNKIDQQLEQMSNNKELWTDEALAKSIEWDQCRELARELLELLL